MANISSIREVLSSTLAQRYFSKFLSWDGDKSLLKMTRLALLESTYCLISSNLPCFTKKLEDGLSIFPDTSAQTLVPEDKQSSLNSSIASNWRSLLKENLSIWIITDFGLDSSTIIYFLK